MPSDGFRARDLGEVGLAVLAGDAPAATLALAGGHLRAVAAHATLPHHAPPVAPGPLCPRAGGTGGPGCGGCADALDDALAAVAGQVADACLFALRHIPVGTARQRAADRHAARARGRVHVVVDGTGLTVAAWESWGAAALLEFASADRP